MTTRPFLSRPSQWKTASLTSARGLVLAIAPVAIVVSLARKEEGAAAKFAEAHRRMHLGEPVPGAASVADIAVPKAPSGEGAAKE